MGPGAIPAKCLLVFSVAAALLLPATWTVATSTDTAWVEGAWSTPFRYDLAEDRDAYEPRLVVDSDGRIHGVFRDWSTYDDASFLSVIEMLDDRLWVVSSIPGTFGVVSHSLAIGPNDGLHLAAAMSGEVRYFSGVSGVSSWTDELIDSVPSDYCRVIVDSDDRVHVLYTDTEAPALKHATRAVIGWAIETIHEVGAVDAVTLDSSNAVHGCNHSEDGVLTYFSNSSGGWASEVVDPSCDPSWWCDIALKSDDTPVIVYSDETSGDLRYASCPLGEWFVTELAHDAGHSSLAIDSHDNAVVSYVSDFDVYFMRTDGAVRSWTTIQSGSSLASPTAIAADPDGYVHILYRYSHTPTGPLSACDCDQLVYATNALGVPYGPRSLQISVGWGGLKLAWSPDGGETYSYEVDGYRIYKGNYEGDEVLLASVRSTQLSYMDEDVNPDLTYYYRVTSYNEFGESLLEYSPRANTESWDWEIGSRTGLTYAFYALLVCVTVAVVLLVFVAVQNRRLKRALAPAPPEEKPVEKP